MIFEDLGEQLVKNIAHPARAFQLRISGDASEQEALTPTGTPSPVTTTAEVAPDPLDLAFWESVKDSERREELEAYLEQHPNGHFSGLARARPSSPDDT